MGGVKSDIEAYLEKSTRTFQERDFETYLETLDFPVTIAHQSRSIIVTTPEEIRVQFDSLFQAYKSEKIELITRRLIDYHLLGDDLALVRFESRDLSRAGFFFSIGEMVALLRKRMGEWRLSMLASDLVNQEWPSSQIRASQSAEPKDQGTLFPRYSAISTPDQDMKKDNET